MIVQQLTTHNEANSFLANVFTPITDMLVEWERDHHKHKWIHLKEKNGWQFFINEYLQYVAFRTPANGDLFAIGLSIKDGKIKRAEYFIPKSDLYKQFYSLEHRLSQIVYEEKNIVLVDNFEDGLYSKSGIYSIRFFNEFYTLYEDGCRLLHYKETNDLGALKATIRARVKIASEYKNIKKTICNPY